MDDIIKQRNKEMTELEMAGQSEKITQKVRSGYLDEGVIWRYALDEYTSGALDGAAIDASKDDYKSFAWFVAFAPYENPRIAVAVLLFQGAHGGYAAPVARDIIAEYLDLEEPVDESLVEAENLQGAD